MQLNGDVLNRPVLYEGARAQNDFACIVYIAVEMGTEAERGEIHLDTFTFLTQQQLASVLLIEHFQLKLLRFGCNHEFDEVKIV